MISAFLNLLILVLWSNVICPGKCDIDLFVYRVGFWRLFFFFSLSHVTLFLCNFCWTLGIWKTTTSPAVACLLCTGKDHQSPWLEILGPLKPFLISPSSGTCQQNISSCLCFQWFSNSGTGHVSTPSHTRQKPVPQTAPRQVRTLNTQFTLLFPS